MAESSKGIRLSRIARDLNVGISTIVEFLHKKGIEIESNPNSKIPAEYYDILLKEYKSDSEIKKESEKLIQSARLRKETLSIEDQEEFEVLEDEEIKVVALKETSSEPESEPEIKEITHEEPKQSAKSTEKEKPVVKEIEEIKIEVKGPKVVGEIDPKLIEKPKKKVSKKKAEKTVDEAKKAEEIKEKEKSEPTVEESKPKVIEAIEPKVEAEPVKTPEPEPESEVDAKEPRKESPQVAKKPKEEALKEIIQETPEEKPSEPQEQTVEEEAKPEQLEAESKTDQPEDSFKVVGKIDLESINQRTRPTKKSKNEKEKERIQKQKARKEAQEEWRKKVAHIGNEKTKTVKDTKAGKKNTEPEEASAEEFIETKVDKLSGPTVVGKIELPVQEPKKSKAKSKAKGKAKEDADAKKKRKRIHKERVNLKDGDKKRKDSSHDKFGTRKHTKKTSHRAEISDEDVQKQIKDTLARLTSKGKSKASKYRRAKRDDVRQKQQEDKVKAAQEKSVLKVSEFISVSELATLMNVSATEIISTCMTLGLFVSINQRLDAETMTVVSDEFGYSIEFVSIDEEELIDSEDDDSDEDLVFRPPIITVMGHVDHGKTSLLDHIRSANVIAGEAGGITQHIGAYRVELPDGRIITFLDTPGHEAFTAMRARGAKVTDIAIIVVAADDNVMPQTVEAINHAQAAGVPIVFAINKIDKPGANPERIKEELANMNYLVEEWGGKYQSQDISAKKGEFVDELLEKVLLEAEMLDLKANPDRLANGTIIESSLDKGRGYVATILVQTGTLRVGDIILAGPYYGHVKAMFNERGKKIKEAGPSAPVLILGLNGAPQAGDKFNCMDSEQEAREIANKREQLLREQGLRTKKHLTLDEIGRRLALGDFHEINVIVKGDVDGSIEALADSLIKLSTEHVQVNVIHKAVGAISESDIMLATASNAIVVGFQVRPSMGARKLAEKEQIDIRLYSIIYDAINEMKDAMEGMLSPDIKEEIVATVEVRAVFKITKVGSIAGCMVKEGKILRNSKVRIIRDGIVVYTGDLGSLKRFKDDVKEVASGYECGLNINNFNDIKVGDIIEAYKEVEVKRSL